MGCVPAFTFPDASESAAARRELGTAAGAFALVHGPALLWVELTAAPMGALTAFTGTFQEQISGGAPSPAAATWL